MDASPDRTRRAPEPLSSQTRRTFLAVGGTSLAAVAVSGCATTGAAGSDRAEPSGALPATDFETRFDPWIEIDRTAFRGNVRAASALAGGRPILAVVKNNAYGLGDRTVGPLLAEMPEVGAIACVRVEEALAMRSVGVTKPIVVMAECSEEEMAELVRHDVLPSVWLDDASGRIARVARRVGRPVPVQLFLDTGMNREGMPYTRAPGWIAEIARSDTAVIDGTYTMFSHDLEFDLVQLERFEALLAFMRAEGIGTGTVHASPTVELFHLPQAHYDMVRPGNALFGNYPRGEGVRERARLAPVYRLRSRVVRVERLEPGESAGFYRTYEPEQATWIALLPVGRTDGYPSGANGACEVWINGRTYPVRGGVNSAHAIVDIGSEKTVSVGDVATLVGPDHPAVFPATVAETVGMSVLALQQSMNARLPRRVV